MDDRARSTSRSRCGSENGLQASRLEGKREHLFQHVLRRRKHQSEERTRLWLHCISRVLLFSPYMFFLWRDSIPSNWKRGDKKRRNSMVLGWRPSLVGWRPLIVCFARFAEKDNSSAGFPSTRGDWARARTCDAQTSFKSRLKNRKKYTNNEHCPTIIVTRRNVLEGGPFSPGVCDFCRS